MVHKSREVPLPTETEAGEGHLAFFMVKGDLSKEVFQNDTSLSPDSSHSQERIKHWLQGSLPEYAEEVCGVSLVVEETLLIEGLTKTQLVQLYGEEHGRWMDSLTPEDHDTHMTIYDGTYGPLVLATIRVKGSTSSKEAEEMLIQVRDTFRKDWHEYLGKEEIVLPGGSRMFLSAIHSGNYEEDSFLFAEFKQPPAYEKPPTHS